MMLDETYPALYRDQFGEETTTIHNDGRRLHFVLRGKPFTSMSPDDLSLDKNEDLAQEPLFLVDPQTRGLSDYTLDFDMPLPMTFHTESVTGTLHIHVVSTFVPPGPRLSLILQVAGFSFAAEATSGGFPFFGFEDALGDIAKQLPEDLSIRVCLFCSFCLGLPDTQPMFGDRGCFRNQKQLLRTEKHTKRFLSMIWKDQPVEFVQETYTCPEFEPRPTDL